MPDPTQTQDPTLRLQYYKETGQADLASKYEQYLKETNQLPSRPTPTGHNGVPFVNAKPEGKPGVGTKTLGVIAALNRDIPGAEAGQAGVRAVLRNGGGTDFLRGASSGSLTDRLAGGVASLVSSPSYRVAREDIRRAEDAAPWQATLPARFAGAGLSAAAIPGNSIMQGARFGALSGLGQSDPTLSAKDRVDAAGVGAGLGAAGGAVIPLARSGAVRGVVDVGRAALGNRGAQARVAGRIVGGIRSALSEAAPEEAAAAPARGTPLSLSDLRPRRLQTPTPVEAPPSSVVLDAVKQAPRQAHRTAAQFQNFAERMGAAPPPSSLDKQLNTLLTQARKATPNEVGSTVGDAEVAMGLAPEQQPDLEDLLRRSIAMTTKRP
jgi:hypothetical protein